MSRKLILAFSLIFYAVSLALPVVLWPTGGVGYADGPPGLFGLLAGFMVLVMCTPFISGLSWLANVTFVLSLISHRREKLQKILAGSTLVLASLFWPIESIPMDDSGLKTGLIPGSGYYLWLTSIVFLNLYAWTKADSTSDTASRSTGTHMVVKTSTQDS